MDLLDVSGVVVRCREAADRRLHRGAGGDGAAQPCGLCTPHFQQRAVDRSCGARTTTRPERKPPTANRSAKCPPPTPLIPVREPGESARKKKGAGASNPVSRASPRSID